MKVVASVRPSANCRHLPLGHVQGERGKGGLRGMPCVAALAQRGLVGIDEVGGRRACDESGMLEAAPQKAGIGRNTERNRLGEAVHELAAGFFARGAMGDQLCDHRIVEGQDVAAVLDGVVDAQSRGRAP